MRHWALAAILFLVAWGGVARADQLIHPRLIIDSQRLDRLRQLTHPTGDPRNWTLDECVMQLAYRSITAAAETLSAMPATGAWWGEAGGDSAGAGQQGAQFQGLATLAMAHLLRTGEPAYDAGKKYLAATLRLLDRWRELDYPMWGDRRFCDLNTGELLGGWALAFDWLGAEMDSIQIRHSLEALSTLSSRMEQGGCLETISGRTDNNHVGVAYGGLGLAALAEEGYLSGDEESIRRRRLESSAAEVSAYLEQAFPDGSGYEGVMYANYGMNLSLPFALATARLQATLPASEVVRIVPGRGVQQAGTWLAYEQLPQNRFGASPLNDTEFAPWDLNGPLWRAWPWLMAWPDPRAPSAVRHLFLTTYPPAEMRRSVLIPFDPDHPQDVSGALFSKAGGKPDARYYNAVAILLGWPEPGISAAAYLDPSAMPASRAFPARGLVVFRTSLQTLDASGELSSDPRATQITFECRRRSPYTANGGHNGHVQFDLNQFTVSSRGQPFFWDSGYEGWPPRNGTHNTHMIQPEGGEWMGFRPDAPTEGTLLRWYFGKGSAPSMAAGDDAAAWNDSASGGPPLVDRSRRHFLVIPRGTGEAPYILFHDDLDYAGEAQDRARWFWHSGNGGDDPDFRIDLGARKASIKRGRAVAVARVLSPDSLESMTSTFLRPGTGPWDHWVLTVQTGPRRNADLVVLATFAEDGVPSLRATALPTSSPEVLGFAIVEGSRTDLAVFRKGDGHGIWTAWVDGRPFSGDADQALLRLSGTGPGWGNIYAGAMIQGSELLLDGRLVAGLHCLEGRGDMVFSPEQVEVRAPLTAAPGYLVAPFIPASAVVNGVSEAVRFWETPVPAWLPAGDEEAWLGPARPNPLVDTAEISFFLRSPGRVRLAVYDLQGRQVSVLEDGDLSAGLHGLRWPAAGGNGRAPAGGIYFTRLQVGGRAWSRKLTMLR